MDQYQKVSKILTVILLLNLLVAGIKIALGLFVDSQSIFSDGVHSISDGLGNVVGLAGISLAKRPKDEAHPYGHGKYEAIFGLVIGALLLFLGGRIFLDSLNTVLEPKVINITWSAVMIMVATLVVNLGISTYESRIGKRLDSTILISDAKHTRSDCYITIGVLVGLVLMLFGLPSIVDGIVGFVVVGFIFYGAYEVLTNNINLLLDGKKVDEEEVMEVVKTFEEIKGVHNIRSRGLNQNVFLDMHILVDKEMSIAQSHHLEHQLREKIKTIYGKHSEILVHVEPYLG